MSEGTVALKARALSGYTVIWSGRPMRVCHGLGTLLCLTALCVAAAVCGLQPAVVFASWLGLGNGAICLPHSDDLNETLWYALLSAIGLLVLWIYRMDWKHSQDTTFALSHRRSFVLSGAREKRSAQAAPFLQNAVFKVERENARCQIGPGIEEHGDKDEHTFPSLHILGEDDAAFVIRFARTLQNPPPQMEGAA